MLAAGLCCIVGGDLVYALYERVLDEPAPFPSLADALYLAGCPLIGLSLVLLAHARTAGRTGELDRRDHRGQRLRPALVGLPDGADGHQRRPPATT
jgi:hypothetical protein